MKIHSLLALSFLAPSFTGCISGGDCPYESPWLDESNCRQPDARFEQPVRSLTQAYAPGQGLRVKAKLPGAVSIHVGSSPDVTVNATPYVLGYADDGEAFARAQMDEFVSVESALVDGEIVIESKGDGATSYLGADIAIEVPASFTGSLFVDGGYEYDPNRKDRHLLDVDLTGTEVLSTTVRHTFNESTLLGVGGPLAIDVGDVTVVLSRWATTGEGHITGGTVDLRVPASSDGVADLWSNPSSPPIVIVDPPASWVVTPNDTLGHDETVVMGAGAGAHVSVRGANGVKVAVE